ncbi:hypothetical protein BC834DRAFT_1025172 [Gloeopeniophorella convolvens]|nr:hypothetical protein BC834DRAFT_1025172 [Gloeopeniophorella convolvens]
MATAQPKTASTPASRRSSSISSHTSTPSRSSSITKGATARSAVNPRVSASLNSPRRPSFKSTTPPPANGDDRDVLAASLKRETDEKERLLVQLQNKEQTITVLTEENGNMSTTLNAVEARLYEFYTEQARMEEEMSARIEVAEKLRAQVRELEKEKRDLHRRYNEQTATFEAERQAFYDNEQHLKSRIQSLTQARRQPPIPHSPSVSSIPPETDTEDEEEEPVQPAIPLQDKEDLDSEPAEMTALRLELSTLSTSYASLHNTLALLQTQLVDLKRVNHQLQEENESYNILLREKTLSGQYDLLKQVNGDRPNSSDDDDDDDDGHTDDTGDVQSMRSGAHSSQLGTVDEHPDEVLHAEFVVDADDLIPQSEDEDSLALDGSTRGKRSRHGRGRQGRLPITGPGLDLAAELGRAENKDILEGQTVEISNAPKVKRGKKGSSESRKAALVEPGMEPSTSLGDFESLRNEIKSLRDANKALSLYASKIIDRIIAQEGFEHVLAIDYEAKTPATATPNLLSPTPPADESKSKRRNTMFARSAASPPTPSPKVERLTTFDSPPTPSLAPPPVRPNRRSLSFDWRSLSALVGGDKKPEPTSNLRPLTLVGGARKLETHEDEEDRKERERLDATMKLMGIEKPPAPPSIQKSYSSPESAAPVPENVASPSLVSRFAFFRRNTVSTDTPTPPSLAASQENPINLTQDTLVQAQAEESLAALDARERALSAEIAKGSSGGFTEIVPRRKSGSKRSHTSGGGSGGTVWSAGMSRTGDDD